MLKLNADLKERISYILIGCVLLTAIVPLFVTVDTQLVFYSRAILSGALAAFYLLTVSTKDLFFISLALFVVQALLQLVLPVSTTLYYSLLLAVPLVFSAVTFGVLTYTHSKEYKAFEMLECLLAVFLIISASKYFIVTEYSVFFSFGVSFIIATLMYNNNLWLRYKESEKDLLIFLLVISFVEVIQVSSKHISF